MGPYEVDTIYDNGVVRIKNIDENQTSLVINGLRMKVYHKPLSKDDFVKNVLQTYEMQLVSKRVSPSADLP
jgi:hypothetical protein